MGSIQTGIQLNDRFTSVLSSIINNVNIAVSRMEELNSSMSANVNTASWGSVRENLAQAAVSADELNSEMQRMNSGAAVSQSERLNQSVRGTKQGIQDNAREQTRFNQTLQQGKTNAGGLMRVIRNMVGAYATIRTVQNVVGASDSLIQTTARLDMMNDGMQKTEELVNMVYASAQDARGSFADMAGVVARLGNNAKDAFNSSAEVVQFANLVQKQMTIAGASTEEASNAMIQLSQALGSGVLRGDELNSIFEQAPNLIGTIADYLGVNVGKIREMASEGQLTADVVKNAILGSADDINAAFNNMPMTWSQVWTSFKNSALIAFQPVLQKINELANNPQFQNFVNNAISALSTVAGYVMEAFNVMATIGTFVSENWSMVSPVIYGVIGAIGAYLAVLGILKAMEIISIGVKGILMLASFAHAAATGAEASANAVATAEQLKLNAALLACPLTWVILSIIAAIAVVIALANHFSGAEHIAQSAFGAICGAINVTIQFFKNLGLEVANIALGINEAMDAVANNIQAAFHNAISAVQSWWYNLLSTVTSVISSICAALNKLPFVNFDYSGITSAADNYAAKSAAAANNKMEYQSISDAFKKGYSTHDVYQKGWVKEAYASGAAWGDGISSKIKNTMSDKKIKIPDPKDYAAVLGNKNNSALTGANNAAAQTAANTADTAANTAKVAKDVEISSENLKYLRDIAERDVINRYTTASINVNSPVNATINSKMDLDGVAEHLRTKIEQQMAAAAEGVH